MADGAKVDYPAHERAYSRFIGMAKNTAIACFIIAFIVIFLIT